jgi:hypothetical protein
MTEDFVATANPDRVHAPAEYPPPPQLGDVIDALDDAAASLKVVVKNQTKSIVQEMCLFVRRRPIAALAIAGTAAYLIGRFRH